MKQRNNETLSLPIYKKTQNTLKTCETFLYAKSLKQRRRKNRIIQLNFRITEKKQEPKVTIAQQEQKKEKEKIRSVETYFYAGAGAGAGAGRGVDGRTFIKAYTATMIATIDGTDTKAIDSTGTTPAGPCSP